MSGKYWPFINKLLKSEKWRKEGTNEGSKEGKENKQKDKQEKTESL